MLKPSVRGMPLALPPRPMRTSRRARSFRSTQRLKKTLAIPSPLPNLMWLSIMAASRLLAAVMA